MTEHHIAGEAPHYRADLTTFFGVRGHVYVAYYDKREGYPRALPLSWSWPAFGGWIAWTCYRKLWLYSLAALILPVAADYFFPFIGGLAGYCGVALFAKEACLRAARQAIRAADRLGLEGGARQDHLQRSGGVSAASGLAATVVVLVLGVVWAYLILEKILLQMDAMGLLPPG